MTLVELSEDDLTTITGSLVESYINRFNASTPSEEKKYKVLHDRIQDIRKGLHK